MEDRRHPPDLEAGGPHDRFERPAVQRLPDKVGHNAEPTHAPRQRAVAQPDQRIVRIVEREDQATSGP